MVLVTAEQLSKNAVQELAESSYDY
jgi:hypothetical protein